MKYTNRFRRLSIVFFALLFTGLGSAQISIDVQSASGPNLDNFDITVTGEDTDVNRENIDYLELDLETGSYDLEISKNNYRSIERTIDVNEGDETSYLFSMAPESSEDGEEDSDIEITRVDSPEEICSGESFSVDFDIRNRGEDSEVVSTTGRGFGSILAGKSFVVKPSQTRTYRFIFTSVEGTGEKQFTVSASNSDSDSTTGTINLRSCDIPGSTQSVENIDVNVYPIEGRGKAFVNEVVRVKGFADGSRGPVELNLSLNGEKIGNIQTQPDGYFQTYFRSESDGRKTVTVSTSKVSDSDDFQVVPTAGVGNIRSEDEVFSGESFELCADVNSVISPKVVLLENGDVLESQNARGEVCFDIEVSEAGEYSYEVRALTYGSGGSAEKEVEVLEQGPEASSFPGQISAVETEDGILKVELYNTNSESTNYTVRLNDVPVEWVSEPVQNISLNKGERETVFFYLSPGERGDFEGILEVESGGEVIYSDDVGLYATGREPVSNSLNIWRVAVIALQTLF